MTLIQAGHLPVIARLARHASISPEWLRRNLLISGINLVAHKDRPFRIGTELVVGTGLCHACSRREVVLAPGGYNALCGHGGIPARVLESTERRVGDVVIMPSWTDARL